MKKALLISLTLIFFCCILGFNNPISYCQSANVSTVTTSTHHEQALDLIHKGNNTGALKEFELALKDSPDNAYILADLGACYYNLGRIQEAMNYTEKAISIDPNIPYAYFNRALCLAAMGGDSQKELSDYTKAIELQPNYARAYGNRAANYFRSDQLEKAMEDINLAIKYDPAYSTAYNTRAAIYLQEQKYELALKDANEAINLNGSYADAYNTRGCIYTRMGDNEKAISDFKHTLELDPNHHKAQENLKSLQK